MSKFDSKMYFILDCLVSRILFRKERKGFLSFDKDFLIELDEYPAVFVPRKRAVNHLPSSTSVVSFLVDSLDDVDVKWRRPPRKIQDFPYNGRKVGVTIGPAGEWIELIEE